MLKIFALCAIMACISVIEVDSNPALLSRGFVPVEVWPKPISTSTTTAAPRPSNRTSTTRATTTTRPQTITPLELWTYTNNTNKRYVRFSEKDWRELDGLIVITTFKEISRRNDAERGLVVGLQNDDINAVQRRFVALTSEGAYQGPREKGLERYASGTWTPIQNQGGRRETQVDMVGPELWVQTMNETHYFEKVSSMNWIEYYQGKVVDEYKWIQHQIPFRKITLKSTTNEDKYYLLTPTSQYEMSASGFKLTITKLLNEGGWFSIGKRWWTDEKWTFSNDSEHFFNHTLEKTWSEYRNNELYRFYDEVERSLNPPEVLLVYHNRGPFFVRLSLTNAEYGFSTTDMTEIGEGTFENFSQPGQQVYDKASSNDETIEEKAQRVCPPICLENNLHWTGTFKTKDGLNDIECLCEERV